MNGLIGINELIKFINSNQPIHCESMNGLIALSQKCLIHSVIKFGSVQYNIKKGGGN